MAIPSIHSSSSILPSESMDSSLSTQSETLLVGELTIGGRCYIVSIESSESLVSTPLPNTQEKIKYLADLYLKHLESQGADLSKIVLQQIDEERLSFVNLLGNDEVKEETLPSSNIEFIPFNSFKEENPFKEEGTISSIKQIYDSIIDPLIAKNGESKREEISPTTSKGSKNKLSRTQNSDPRIIFTQNPQETEVKTIDNSTPNSTLRNCGNKESSNEISKEIEDSSTETESSEESTLNLLQRAWQSATEWLPTFSLWRSGSYEVIDSAKIVEAEKEEFLQANPEVQKELEKFKNINLK